MIIKRTLFSVLALWLVLSLGMLADYAQNAPAAEATLGKKVMTFVGPPGEAVKLANAAIKQTGTVREAGPVEFCAVGADMVAITINWKKSSGPIAVITATTTPDQWSFKNGKNHPTLFLDGEVWYFGVL